MNTRALLASVAFLAVVCIAGIAQAWDRPYFADYAVASWLWPSGDLYVRDAYPPYFAMYPPVYYSYPVPRTYGFSPYAYPPGTPTPPSRQIVPLTVCNQYVANNGVATEQSAQKRPPLRIANPFVSTPEAPSAPVAPGQSPGR